VRLQLIPREERFFDLFVEDAANVLGGARLLESMLRSYDEVERRAADIAEAEHRGDEINREIRAKLETTFVPPIGRDDVRALIGALDAVLEGVEEAADTFVLYDVETPTAAAVELAALIVRQCEQIHESLTQLHRFHGLDGYRSEIQRLANEGKRVSRTAVATLFEGDDPMSIIKWRKLYQVLETTVDRCEDVSDIIERITLKNA
jgi:uncharacterized protein